VFTKRLAQAIREFGFETRLRQLPQVELDPADALQSIARCGGVQHRRQRRLQFTRAERL